MSALAGLSNDRNRQMTNATIGRSILGLAIMAFLGLSACSSEPEPMDTGERISARGEAIAARGEAWSAGQDEVKKGQELVADSESHVAELETRIKRADEDANKARDQIELTRADRAKGESLIASGNTKMARAEAADKMATSAPPASVQTSAPSQ